MTHRGYRNQGGEMDLSLYGRRETLPDTRPGQKGLCICGTETMRWKTVGPPGHPLNGWQCDECARADMKALFDKGINRFFTEGA